MGKCHILSGDGPPVALPQFAGQHYQDNLNGVPYLSVSTAGVLSWQAQVDSGAIATSIAALQAQVDDLEDDVLINEDDIEDLEIDQAAHINDVANPHATSLLNLTDVATTAYSGGNRFFKLRTNAAGTGVELFETFEASASRTDPLLHQATTFAQYLTLTADIPVAGEYLLFMSHRFSLNATNVNFESHVLFNNQFLSLIHI